MKDSTGLRGNIPELLLPADWAAPGRIRRQSPGGTYGQGGKRLLDVFLVLLTLPLTLPLIATLALIVARDGGAPFYGHERIGRNGRPFICWKLRTMVRDADRRLDEHLARNPEARAEWVNGFKLRRDPRVTRLGRFLRRSSLDELPQLWNILRGDMSLVGPRPVTRDELRLYGANVIHYFRLRPGLTGLWQVSGRNDTTYDQRVAMDVAYARAIGLVRDLRLILATFSTVLKRTGC